MDKQQTIKATEKSRKSLRLISALTGEKQYAVLDRLLDAELITIQNKANGGASIERKREASA